MKFDYLLTRVTRLQCTAGLKAPLQILYWICSNRKECSKILKISEKPLQNRPFFSQVTGLQSRISDVTKTGSQKNVSCEYSEIANKYFLGKSRHFINVGEL